MENNVKITEETFIEKYEFLTEAYGYVPVKLEVLACSLVEEPGWVPYLFTKVDNGVTVKGGICDRYVKGPKKGRVNYRAMDRDTVSTVVVPKETFDIFAHLDYKFKTDI